MTRIKLYLDVIDDPDNHGGHDNIKIKLNPCQMSSKNAKVLLNHLPHSKEPPAPREGLKETGVVKASIKYISIYALVILL